MSKYTAEDMANADRRQIIVDDSHRISAVYLQKHRELSVQLIRGVAFEACLYIEMQDTDGSNEEIFSMLGARKDDPFIYEFIKK